MGVDGIRCDRVFSVLEQRGYFKRRVCGSHFIFVKPGFSRIPVSVHGSKVRPDVLLGIWRA